jgi:hypothetical protein
MSGLGRCAGSKRELRRCRQDNVTADPEPHLDRRLRQRQCRRRCGDCRSGQLDHRANCALLVGDALRRMFCGNGRSIRCRRRRLHGPAGQQRRIRRAEAGDMHMPERQRELDRQREQGAPSTKSQVRADPTHRRRITNSLTLKATIACLRAKRCDIKTTGSSHCQLKIGAAPTLRAVDETPRGP